MESRKSKSSPKRDWYVWKPPKGYSADGKPLPPNNWSQLLGDANSAWTYDPATEEFYLSLFTPEQPDLNWENPAVRDAVHGVMEFWLKRGCCGFRMDVINHISKDQRFPDAEPNLPNSIYHVGSKYFANGPRMHEYLREINDKVLSKYDAMTVGEMPFVNDIEEIMRAVSADRHELNQIFIFDIVNIDRVPGDPHPFETLRTTDASDISAILSRWQHEMVAYDGWNALFLENHDQPRSLSRFVDDSDTWRERGAKLLALMQTTLSGTLYVYQGEELGMRNMPAEWDPETVYKDILSLNTWKKAKALYGKDPEKLKLFRTILAKKARDHARTPMQWNASANGGFCGIGATPWMRSNADYATVNAEAQLAPGAGEDGDGVSVFRFWQRGLENRRKNKDIFVYGAFEVVGAAEETRRQVFAYVRTPEEGKGWRALVVLNFSGAEVEWEVPVECEVERWVVSNYAGAENEKAGKGKIVLRPWEGLLGKCA